MDSLNSRDTSAGVKSTSASIKNTWENAAFECDFACDFSSSSPDFLSQAIKTSRHRKHKPGFRCDFGSSPGLAAKSSKHPKDQPEHGKQGSSVLPFKDNFDFNFVSDAEPAVQSLKYREDKHKLSELGSSFVNFAKNFDHDFLK